MLLNYTFSNFRSFKAVTALSLIATQQTTLHENLIRKNSLRILPSAVIYGANASGKSNIIMSLEVMKSVVLSGSLYANLPVLNNLELYPFAHDQASEPMTFSIDFIHREQRIVYSFKITLGKFKKGDRSVVEECLKVVSKTGAQVHIFERNQDGITLMKNQQALKVIEFDEKVLKEFEKKINKNLDQGELFLPRAFKSTINNELAEIVLDFFSNELVVVSDFTLKKTNLTFSVEDSPNKDVLAWNKIIDVFVKNADFGPQSMAFHAAKNDENKTTDTKLVSIYSCNDQNYLIPAELMESRGTLKLVDFAIPFERLFSSGGVFVIDEFDAAIHPELTKGVIALFNNAELNKKGAQLIFTTHNPIYLDNKMFRRDQIRFVEKDKDTYESVVYSLADFGSETVRNDHNYLINYFKGNYGALPFLDFSALLKLKGDNEGGDDAV
jgi:uncharacterized protein